MQVTLALPRRGGLNPYISHSPWTLAVCPNLQCWDIVLQALSGNDEGIIWSSSSFTDSFDLGTFHIKEDV